MIRTLLPVLAFLSLTACPKDGGSGGTPSTAEAAPVEKVVRDFYTAYTAATTGDQARAALDAQCTPAFVDGLKAKATACSSAASSGKPDPACDNDPVVCASKKTTLTAVVVQSVAKSSAVATAVVTPDGAPPASVRITLGGDAAATAWKIASIECPH